MFDKIQNEIVKNLIQDIKTHPENWVPYKKVHWQSKDEARKNCVNNMTTRIAITENSTFFKKVYIWKEGLKAEWNNALIYDISFFNSIKLGWYLRQTKGILKEREDKRIEGEVMKRSSGFDEL